MHADCLGRRRRGRGTAPTPRRNDAGRTRAAAYPSSLPGRAWPGRENLSRRCLVTERTRAQAGGSVNIELTDHANRPVMAGRNGRLSG
jgi:hypothetical protein